MALPRKAEPWLVQFHGERNQRSQTFYSMSQRRRHVESIPEIRSHRIAATSHGWLLLIWDCREYDHDCFLLNPATMEKIQLPDWPDLDSTYEYCFLSSPPTVPDCVVLFTLSTDEETTFLYCKPGDEDWKRQQLHIRCSCEVEGELEAEPLQFAAMTTIRGEIYAIANCCDTLFKVQINRIDDDGGGSCSLSVVDVNVTKPDALFHHYIRADVDSRI
ncbi:unnamed protein product [Linum trigynum]|uniref:KIB1-4 beta-propeller domain-containing protein n=1 Tax=Linum trigynum TaxID=586398 RepID=A0AAV2FZG6_9ROSI